MARYPAQFIFTPQVTDLTTIVSGIDAIIALPSTEVINRIDLIIYIILYVMPYLK